MIELRNVIDVVVTLLDPPLKHPAVNAILGLDVDEVLDVLRDIFRLLVDERHRAIFDEYDVKVVRRVP